MESITWKVWAVGESGRGCPVLGTAGAHSRSTTHHLQTKLQTWCLWEILKGEKPTKAEKKGKNKKEKSEKSSVKASEEVRRCSRHWSTHSPQGRACARAGNEHRKKEWQEGTAEDHGILPAHVEIQLYSHNVWFLTIPECLFCPCDFEMGSLGEQISWEVSTLTGCFPG